MSAPLQIFEPAPAAAFGRRILFFCFAAFIIMGVIRIHFDLGWKPSDKWLYGNTDTTVIRVWNIAQKWRSENPQAGSAQLIFNGHNPGLFLYSAETALMLGVKSMTGLRYLSLLLAALGLALQFLWVRRLFGDFSTALITILFCVLTPAALHYSASLHQHSYNYFFANAAFYFWLRHLTENKISMLILALAAYFGACLNYTMQYFNIFIGFIALQAACDEKLITPRLIFASVIPVAAMSLTLYQMSLSTGSFSSALRELGGTAAARMADARIEGSSWEHSKTRMQLSDWLMYPYTISDRVRKIFFIDAAVLIAGLLWVRSRHAGNTSFRRYALWWILGALSWHLLMPQHTKIHRFSAVYGFAYWPLIFALIVREFSVKMKTFSGSSQKKLRYAFYFLAGGLFIYMWLLPVFGMLSTN